MSNVQKYIVRLKGDREDMFINETQFKQLTSDEGVKQLSGEKFIEINGKLVNTFMIDAVEEYRNYEEENRPKEFNPPVNKHTLELWRECKDTFRQCIKDKVKFDPYLHFPEEWQAKLPPKESLTYTHGRYSLLVNLEEKDALDSGRAIIDWPDKPLNPKEPPAYPVVCYIYAKQQAYNAEKIQDLKQAVAHDKNWDNIMETFDATMV